MMVLEILLVIQRVDFQDRSEEHTSELQSLTNLVCRLLLEKNTATSKLTQITIGSFRSEAFSSRATTVRPTEGLSRRTSSTRLLMELAARFLFFFFNDTATPEIYPLPLPDALPISVSKSVPTAMAVVVTTGSGTSVATDVPD